MVPRDHEHNEAFQDAEEPQDWFMEWKWGVVNVCSVGGMDEQMREQTNETSPSAAVRVSLGAAEEALCLWGYK